MVIIGSGPAGLTAAYYLTIQGHSVMVFESLSLAGGACSTKAAVAIDKFLGGCGTIDAKLIPLTEPEKYLGLRPGFAAMTRCAETCLLPDERVQSFCKVVEDVDEEAAEKESKRCLQCDLRLKIMPVEFWGNY